MEVQKSAKLGLYAMMRSKRDFLSTTEVRVARYLLFCAVVGTCRKDYHLPPEESRSGGQYQAVPSPEPCKDFFRFDGAERGGCRFRPICGPHLKGQPYDRRHGTPATRQYLHRRSQPARSRRERGRSAASIAAAELRLVRVNCPKMVPRHGRGGALTRRSSLRMEAMLGFRAIWANNSRMHVDRNIKKHTSSRGSSGTNWYELTTQLQVGRAFCLTGMLARSHPARSQPLTGSVPPANTGLGRRSRSEGARLAASEPVLGIRREGIPVLLPTT